MQGKDVEDQEEKKKKSEGCKVKGGQPVRRKAGKAG